MSRKKSGTAICEVCNIEFTPMRGAKARFCSQDCSGKGSIKPKPYWFDCSVCLAKIGFGMGVTARMIGITKTSITRPWRNYGVKPNYPDGGSWQKYANKRGWLTTAKVAQKPDLESSWWGDSETAKLWMKQHKARFPEWTTSKHPIAMKHISCNYQKKRHAEASPKDPFRLKKICRSRLYNAMKRRARGVTPRIRYRTEDMIGCTVEQLSKHLESKWSKGMSWDNYGTRWEIDHVIPLKMYDILNPDQLRIAMHYTNLAHCGEKRTDQRAANYYTVVSSNCLWLYTPWS